jgi:hypothetical protein
MTAPRAKPENKVQFTPFRRARPLADLDRPQFRPRLRCIEFACFSEIEDDLGQWRGYGDGECGYAVGFRSDGIMEATKARPNTLLLPMSYDENAQNFLVKDVLPMSEVYFRSGLKDVVALEA